MRRSILIPALSLVGLFACNSSGSGDKTASTDTATAKPAAPAADTMHHHMDSTGAVAPVPDIPAGAKVFFKNLKDGATVKSPLKIEMGASGIKVDSAGMLRPGSGHHHILIDAGDSLTAGTVVPKDSTHLHFGNAQTSTEIKLTPGKHRLTLQFADGIHRSYGGKLSSSITVNVKQ
ncbi:MAG: hypothetical protein C5B52_10970 [Bacteroidetes bacterium]|nr:MAG: hypothetical protein C5B52_10970 [Bacteroidota bacterium]